jgi:hypothetical protein
MYLNCTVPRSVPVPVPVPVEVQVYVQVQVHVLRRTRLFDDS